MSRRCSAAFQALVALFVVLTFLTNASATQRERVLISFEGIPDGANPAAALVADGKGNFYGTAANGCTYNYGCVFRVSNVGGIWTETVLYSFSGPDGATPGASVILDSAGNLYGTTSLGGAFNAGTAFKLTPASGGPWTETVLHSFGSGSDGYDPSELILASDGDIYGITQFGGTASSGPDNGGTVYRLSLANGQWTETILYSFPGEFLGPDGDLPFGGLAIDRAGNLYGVTQAGGTDGKGAVFALARGADGTFTERIIHSFHVSDGDLPNSTPVLDSAGNLYGTTYFGGNVNACPSNGCGTIYQLRKNSDGSWTEILLRELQKEDGWQAVGPVVFDRKGNLYAAAQAGGAYSWGSILKLTPSSTAPWKEQVVHNFTNNPDGASPSGILVDASGSIFGTTGAGGNSQLGVIFEIAP
jgi:uncharacterized repeat protein (TIGR03803 family)